MITTLIFVIKESPFKKPNSKDLHILNDGHNYGGTSNKFIAHNPLIISSSMLNKEIALVAILNTDRFTENEFEKLACGYVMAL